MPVTSKDIVFFFGAGTSAPFGIPTMEQFVIDFEKYLNENAEKKERELYSEIKEILKKKIHRNIDLEAIFSVIDGIITYDNPEKLGMLALYFEEKRREQITTADHVQICKRLKTKFQNFIKGKCMIPETFEKIDKVYRDFFSRIAIELGDEIKKGKYSFYPNWVMFTTNYDVCLEYFWREMVQTNLDTNFQHDDIRKKDILRSKSILANPPHGIMKLFKLHGSISWLIDEKTNDVIEVAERGQSLVGASYTGELMLYPIAEKELYLEPHISMLVRLNRELAEKKIWIIVGYSFNDLVIREIFLKNWSKDKKVVLIHPNATEIYNKNLKNIEGYKIEKYFGITDSEYFTHDKMVDYRQVNHQLIHKLKGNPSIRWNQEF